MNRRPRGLSQPSSEAGGRRTPVSSTSSNPLACMTFVDCYFGALVGLLGAPGGSFLGHLLLDDQARDFEG